MANVTWTARERGLIVAGAGIVLLALSQASLSDDSRHSPANRPELSPPLIANSRETASYGVAKLPIRSRDSNLVRASDPIKDVAQPTPGRG
jgi:hypothetical protein